MFCGSKIMCDYFTVSCFGKIVSLQLHVMRESDCSVELWPHVMNILNIKINQNTFSYSRSRTGWHRTYWTNEQHWTSHWNIADSKPDCLTAVLAESFSDICQFPGADSGIMPELRSRSRVSKYIQIPFLTNHNIIRHYITWDTEDDVEQITDKLAAVSLNWITISQLTFIAWI
jgi:hypothetical protein